jgi:hypothetical protein
MYENMKGKYQLAEFDLDRRIILKRILKTEILKP